MSAMQAMESPLSTDVFDPIAGVLHLAVWRIRARLSAWSERTMADAFPIEVALALWVDVGAVLQCEPPDWRQSVY